MPPNRLPSGPLHIATPRRRKRNIFDRITYIVDWVDPQSEDVPKPEKHRQFLPDWLRDELLGRLEDE